MKKSNLNILELKSFAQPPFLPWKDSREEKREESREEKRREREKRETETEGEREGRENDRQIHLAFVVYLVCV